MKKCIVIFNPNSGKKLDKNFLEEYVKILGNHNYETSIYIESLEKKILISDLESYIKSI